MLQSEMIWNAELDNKPTAIITEKSEITVFRSTLQYRIIDFDIHLFALADHLKFTDRMSKPGGFCLRLKLPGDLSFVSENKIVIPEETPVLAGPWMDFTGSFEGESLPKAGYCLCYPHGLGHQYPWILRKVTSMQNTLSRQNTHRII